jgi:heme exporter protein CcmD
MDFSAPHAGFTIAAYAVSALVLAALTLVILLRSRALRRDIERSRPSGQDQPDRQWP